MQKLNFFLLVLILCLYSGILSAQTHEMYEYTFNGNLDEVKGKKPSFIILGSSGQFIEENLPELSNMSKQVYMFSKNSGLQFNNTSSGNIIGESYSIELYFKFAQLNSWKRVIDFKNRNSDNGAYIFDGKLNFYKIVTSDIAPVKAEEYTHYVLSRDGNTKTVTIYADGIAKTSFKDTENDAVPGNDNVLNFFYDDLVVGNEASAGAVAFIRIFGYTLSPADVKKSYEELPKNIIGKVIATHIPEKKLEVTVIGKVLNSKTKQGMKAEIVFKSGIDGREISTGIHTDGSFKISLVPNSSYSYVVKAIGFIDFNDKIDLPASGEVHKTIYLQPIEVGHTMTLHSIIFMQGKSELLPESFPELDKLVQALHDNKTMEIEISGHTDNQGDPKKNLALSEKRVMMVKDYLVSKGIQESRIKGKGYGGSNPIADNSNPETRKLNRRVEFTILKK
jgi:OOP family OmpA-OmpF porin